MEFVKRTRLFQQATAVISSSILLSIHSDKDNVSFFIFLYREDDCKEKIINSYLIVLISNIIKQFSEKKVHTMSTLTYIRNGLLRCIIYLILKTLQDACRILRQHVDIRQTQQQAGCCNDEPDPQRGAPHGQVLPQKKLLFGRFLYHTGIVDFRQIVQALAWQRSGRLKLGELAVKFGYLDRNSVNVILSRSRDSGNSRFGRTAWELGLLAPDEIQKILRYQRQQQKKIGQFFVERGVINRVELDVLLSRWREHNRQVQSIVDGGKRMDTDERRKNIRVLFCTTVDVTFSDTSYTDCATENLSTQGVFVDNISNRALGDECHLTLKLTGTSEESALSMQAEVVRLEKDGIGLHFTEIDLDSFVHLRSIIYYNSNGADTISQSEPVF